MRFGSLFSGIEAASVAWQPLGWRCAWTAEIDPFACALLAHRYPEVPNLGDVNRIDTDAIEPVDLIVFGSPCQSFSVAGKRLGLDDPRGNMALVALGVAACLRPRWLVFENVPGLFSSFSRSEQEEREVREGDVGECRDGQEDRDFAAFLSRVRECGYLGCWRVHDAQYAGVPQRRRRVFFVGYLGDWRPAAAVLFEPESLRGDPPPRREAGQGVARPVASCPEGGSGWRGDADTADNLISNTLSAARGAACAHAADLETYIPISFHGAATEDGTGRGVPLIASTVAANSGRCQVEQQYVAAPMSVRRLTPRECERLQGFPDDYTLIPYRGKPAADGPRYRAIGNSFAVPVVRWIGHRIDQYETARSSAKDCAA